MTTPVPATEAGRELLLSMEYERVTLLNRDLMERVRAAEQQNVALRTALQAILDSPYDSDYPMTVMDGMFSIARSALSAAAPAPARETDR